MDVIGVAASGGIAVVVPPGPIVLSLLPLPLLAPDALKSRSAFKFLSIISVKGSMWGGVEKGLCPGSGRGRLRRIMRWLWSFQVNGTGSRHSVLCFGIGRTVASLTREKKSSV